MVRMIVLAAAGLLAAPPPGAGQQETPPAKRLRETYVAAADWLAGQQDARGAWHAGLLGRSEPSVAYTALIVAGFLNAPEDLRARYRVNASRGVAWLLSRANPDGSFGEGENGSFVRTYATAIALMALSSAEWSDRTGDAMRGARAYLRNHQLREGPHRGGSGYGDLELKRDPETGEFKAVPSSLANLSTTSFAADALKCSGLSLSDEYWERVAEFVRKCQNCSEVNKDPAWRSALRENGLSVGDEGSLFYSPDPDRRVQKAGTLRVGDRETIVGYGSMTYDGIKTYLYAGLRRDSPEVKAAVDWVRRNYSIGSHPGFAFDRQRRHHLRGLYYYHLVMARALDAFSERPFVTADGREHDWPAELAEEFLKTVRESRLWKNDNPAWYEGDPVLVTSYVLNTCDILFKYLR